MSKLDVLDKPKLRSLDRLPFKTVAGYGAGDFGFNLAFSLSTSFLLYYYTDVAGISAAAVGTMFLVVRLWDAFADLLAGRLVDRTMTRWGKFRPFIMFGAVPLLFMSYLVFHVPTSFDSGMKIIYAYATYAILGLVYSLVNIPYGSLASAVTQSVHERAKLVAARAFGAGIGGVILTFVVGGFIQRSARSEGADPDPRGSDRLPGRRPGRVHQHHHRLHRGRHRRLLVHRLGLSGAGDPDPAADQHQGDHRHPEVQQAAGLPVRIELLLPDRVCSPSAAPPPSTPSTCSATSVWSASSPWSTPGIALVITPFIPKIIDRFGKKNVFQYCGLFTIVGGVGLFFAPANMFWLVLITLAIKGIGASLINTVMFGLEADTVEYGEWKTGKRSEGATYALFSFTRKVTQSIGGALGAWALAIGGYIAASATNPSPIQPDSAIIAIKATIGLVPALAALIAMIIFIKYPLNDEKFKQIRDETEARKLADIEGDK